jgi:hypothetical protein
MTRNLFILGILLGLVLLAGGLIQYRYQSYIDRAPVEPVAPPPEFLPVELPTFERLRSPHAILVLDVSGSMKDSDPSHLQSEAVLQFYSVYRDLAREILAKDDAARVAVVLFGTIAQTIDWRGDGDPWLDVSAANTASFRDAIDEYLGHPGTEPRTGQETDYLGALDEVHRLVDGLPSPPAILFMTDGGNDPHLLFTPGMPESQRGAKLAALSGRQRQVFEDISSGRRRWLRPKSATPIFNRRAAPQSRIYSDGGTPFPVSTGTRRPSGPLCSCAATRMLSAALMTCASCWRRRILADHGVTSLISWNARTPASFPGSLLASWRTGCACAN